MSLGRTPDAQEIWQWISRSSRETFLLGHWLGRHLDDGLVIGLCGPLGAGKTHLVQGLARGLGVPEHEPVTSPTFSLINPYEARLPLYHLDVYRLGSPDELELLGFRDLLGPASVTVVEWADLFPEVLPADRLMIQLAHRSPRTRQMSLSAGGPRSWKLLENLQKAQQHALEHHTPFPPPIG